MIRYERVRGGELQAVTSVDVGLITREIRVPLGPWFAEAPDPIGLAMTPVVALPAPAWTEIARAGALRAGLQPPVLLLPADAPSIGGQLLVAVDAGVEVVLVLGNPAVPLRTARALQGRPILALPLDDPGAADAALSELDVDVHIPIPSVDGARRDRIRSLLARLGPENLHHVVEVDPRPAFEGGGAPWEDASDAALAAAAAGVFAGRLAVGNRRWRASLP